MAGVVLAICLGLVALGAVGGLVAGDSAGPDGVARGIRSGPLPIPRLLAVPEPGSAALVGLGLLALAARRRARR